MKFTRLRLTGFKSFVEPTDVPIERGLTGIVGPNGCGKSNLTEALQWVMGESSYKAMRGSGMEDVIFSGSGARPARNSAEVALMLDNSDRSAPAAFNDSDTIEIIRRIERESGSSYRLNGREVRARDVQLLFADASAGSRSPAMVGQGRVGALIAAKPEARRAILEEAAGISGLFGRRHEAELRLKAAEQNLERLEDVLAEIERQLEALRRQARQAVRYRTISGEIRKGEATALAVRYATALDAVAAAQAELDAGTARVETRGDEEQHAATRQATASAALPPLRDAAAAAGEAVQRIRIEEEQLEAEERAVASQLADLERRLVQLTADLERERRLLAENASSIDRLAKEEAALASEEEGGAVRRSEAAERLATAESSLARSEKLGAEAQASLSELRARRQQFEREASEALTRDSRLGEEFSRVERERRDIAGSETQARIDQAAARAEAAHEQVTAAETALGDAEQATIAARDGEAAARATVAESEAALARMEAEAKALRSMLPQTTVADPVGDSVIVRDGAEAALAALFGDELNLSQNAAAESHWHLVAPADDDPALPAGAEPLAALVDAPPVLARRLGQTGLVARADGLRLQAALRPGQSLVSAEGDLWRWDGLVAGAGVRQAEANRLAGRKRLATLNGGIEELRPAMRVAQQRHGAAREALAKASAAEAGTRSAFKAANRNLDEARAALATADRDHGRNSLRLAALAEAEARILAGRAEAQAKRVEAAEALARIPSPDVVEGPLAELRLKIAADRGVVSEARGALAGIDRDAEHRRNRLKTIATERDSWVRRQAGAEAQITTLSGRAKELETERQSLAERPADFATRRQALAEAGSSAEIKRKDATVALSAAEAELAAADKAARAAGEALAQAREQRGRAEERLGGAKLRAAEFAERIVELLQCRPEEAAAAAGLTGAPLPALDQVEARVERLKQERDRLGGVNLQAEQEAEQLAERRSGMIADRDDLVAAIQKLRQGISGLNREGRERLLAAFTSVDEKFRELFMHLFGGGTAELQLTDVVDPLEAGLEIIARPPGKKPQTMTLLSGGEQALTALSLIFAVFLTNPAPICVLDEVDAPLDDANVERFCTLLEEIVSRTDTRFLVTTHNPITMARMSRLFGVTMAERGVSQLVSVDLETAERFREAV